MKHTTWLIFAVIAVLALAGCDQLPDAGGAFPNPFVGGSSGVLMEFETGAPPEAVFDRGTDGGTFPFDIVVKLKNDGEWDIPAGRATLSISGINPVEFGTTDAGMIATIDEELEATRKDGEGNVIPGTIYFATFTDLEYDGDIVGNRQFPIKGDLCYDYGTRATTGICIRKNLRDTSGDAVCEVNEDKQVHSSGAPIKVTSFTQSAAGSDKVSFTFTVAHKGNGNIYKLGSACDGSAYANRNKVHVAVDTRLPELQCRGLSEGDDTSGYVLLSGEGNKVGERAITCTQPIDAQTDFDQVVDITLTYEYKDDVTTTLVVKDSN